jgi:capsular polysaccharide biosynthesis protein
VVWQVTLSAVYRSLRRHRLLLVVLTAATAAAGWHLAALRPAEYRATALVRVQQKIADPADGLAELETAGRLAQTYVQIATTLSVADRIERSLHGRVPLSEITGNLEARQIAGLDLIALSATSPSPATAYAVAARAPAALEGFVASTADTGDRVIVIQAPQLPTRPYAPRPLFTLVVGGLLALLLNAALLFAWDLFADRAVTGEDDDEIGGRPVLALVPTLALKTARAVVSVRPPDRRDDLGLRPMPNG